MQDEYAGDIGDFGKFALLRTLARGERLGVCWYRVPDEKKGNDGSHRAYLDRPERYRALDQTVFDALKSLRDNLALRSIHNLEQLGLLPRAVFHGIRVPQESGSRGEWFDEMRQTVKRCTVVFLDPDNGINRSRITLKSVSCEEISTLLYDRHALLVYHHQTRMKGGAIAESRILTKRMLDCGARRVQAIRLRPYSSRFYFLLNGSDALYRKLKLFARRWGDKVVLFDESR